MRSKLKFTTEQIEAVRAKLKDLPAIEKIRTEHTKADTVKMLSKEIISLQKRGYSLEQIADYIKGEGLDIGTPTMKSYLQRSKAAAAPKPKVQAQKDTHPAAPQTPQTPKPVDSPKGSFSPKPDSDDI
jgi:hypothetical protein